jgi:hypothetical protein
MHEFIEQIGSDNFLGLVAIVGALLIPIVALIGAFTYKCRRLGVEATLKQLMIERGMSADEIKEVLQASIADKPCRGRAIREPSRYR